MLHKNMATVSILSLLLTAGCDAGPGSSTVESTSHNLTIWELLNMKQFSFDLVGRGLNGTHLNGDDLAQHMLVSVSLSGVVMPKGAPKDLTLSATLFKGAQAKGKKPGHRDAVGAVFAGNLDDGTTLKLRIDDSSFTQGSSSTFYRFAVSYQAKEGWLPLCGTDEAGMPVLAMPLNGTWEYREGIEGGGEWSDSDTLFTFACEGYVLAKCVEMGYEPWAEGKLCDPAGNGSDCEKATLQARHQACARALRADYCGDGTSYTVDGMLINLYDGVGIRTDSEEWQLEAEWDEDGAVCLAAQRVPSLPTPACLVGLASPDCGQPDHFEQGTLIMTEIPGTDDSI